MKQRICSLWCGLCLAFFSIPTYADTDIEKVLIINVGEEVTETLQGGNGSTVTNKSEDIVTCTYIKPHQFLFKGLKRGLGEIKIHVPGYNYYYTVKVVDVVSITLPSVLNLHIGEESRLSPIISDMEATTSLTWISTNSSVVSVSEDGKITALNVGSSSVICTAKNGISAQCLVNVNPIHVSGIQLNYTQSSLIKGETLQLNATIIPLNATEKGVLWSSSNENVCITNSDGLVKAIGAGTAIIKATTIDGGFSAACVVDVEQPIKVTAKSYTRTYGAPNPVFEYETEGGVLNGEPEIICEATGISPVGIYPIVITKGAITNDSHTFINGTLTITKAPLTVEAGNYTRTYGEENPAFELKYKGFVNGEDESVLLVKPEATTEADEESDAGVYDITIDNGVAENYSFVYKGGKLTIEKAYQTLTWEQELGKVEQYEQIELTAEASSGLDITYTVEGSPVCSVYKIGNKQFLDCFGEGKAVVFAIQEGNQNYWQTPKKYKTIGIGHATGIKRVITDGGSDVKIYNVNGNRIKELRKGINIVKTGDGKTGKVVMK